MSDEYEINDYSYKIIRTDSLVERAFDGLKQNDIIDTTDNTEYTIVYACNSNDHIAR